jgi:hypothetical protein
MNLKEVTFTIDDCFGLFNIVLLGAGEGAASKIIITTIHETSLGGFTMCIFIR